MGSLFNFFPKTHDVWYESNRLFSALILKLYWDFHKADIFKQSQDSTRNLQKFERLMTTQPFKNVNHQPLQVAWWIGRRQFLGVTLKQSPLDFIQIQVLMTCRTQSYIIKKFGYAEILPIRADKKSHVIFWVARFKTFPRSGPVDLMPSSRLLGLSPIVTFSRPIRWTITRSGSTSTTRSRWRWPLTTAKAWAWTTSSWPPSSTSAPESSGSDFSFSAVDQYCEKRSKLINLKETKINSLTSNLGVLFINC